MIQSATIREPEVRVYTAAQRTCPIDGNTLWVGQHRQRTIHCLNESILATFRDTKCTDQFCKSSHIRYRPAEEFMLALPGSSFGLDVLMAIGSMRLRDDFSFPRIHGRLEEMGVPISPMAVQYQFRNYLSLVSCQVALSDGKLRARLRQQGVILPVIDGVQFGSGDAVLYLIVDAISRQPLFGQELFCRSAADLVPFIAQLKELDIPILSVVSDKEKGLVPAIEEALPEVPHQYCQVHYVGNAAKPMEGDLKALNAEVRETEDSLRKFQRKLLRTKKIRRRRATTRVRCKRSPRSLRSSACSSTALRKSTF